MALDGVMDEKEKKFFEFQKDWYTQLEKFISKGNKIQARLKKEGAIAPTEVLMFLLFWETVSKHYEEKEKDFLKYMFIDILQNDDRFKDDKDSIEFDLGNLIHKFKKDTIH